MNNIEEKEFLKNYDASKFERPSVTNDVLIFTTEDKKEENSRKVPRKGLQVLLIKRDEYPYKGKWSVPGGFVKMDESLEEGALRKLKEKTGIENVYLEQLYTFGEVDRDPRTRIISIGNLALISKDSIIYSENAENKETKWFWVDKILKKKEVSDNYITKKYLLTLKCEDIKINYEVIEKTERTLIRKTTKSYRFLEEESTEKLAFDHYKILDLGIDRLRNKLEYTPIVFNLLPKLFTVKELQFVYEAIMGREILNFRRKMGDMIIETEEKIEGKPFRPAQVFKFNENWEHEF
ncbi:MAG: NUDIX hydrolase [Clostridium sp.]